MMSKVYQYIARGTAENVGGTASSAEPAPASRSAKESGMDKMFQPLKPVTVTGPDEAIKAMQEARRSAKLVNQANNILTLDDANALIHRVNQHIASGTAEGVGGAQSSVELIPAYLLARERGPQEMFQRPNAVVVTTAGRCDQHDARGQALDETGQSGQYTHGGQD